MGENVTDIRDKGRFVAGNKGGPGRPPRKTEYEYLAVIMAECDLDTWRGVVKGAVEAARNGDHKAREWLAGYLVGTPSTKATTPINIVVQQLNGDDPVVSRLAAPEIDKLSPLQIDFGGATPAQCAAIYAKVRERLDSLET